MCIRDRDNPYYMGSVGPKLEDVYQRGCDMTEYFLDKGAKNFVIMSGGSSSGNRLQQVRTWGIDVYKRQVVVSATRINRETGGSPVRSRHCKRELRNEKCHWIM